MIGVIRALIIGLTIGLIRALIICLTIGLIRALRYSIHNDHISYLVYGWWDFCKDGIILKSLSNENYPP
jgi:hypothetical protein